jgi:hypothetical protein
MQSPLQQLLSEESVFCVQLVSARFLHGLSQAAFGLQICTPTSFGSVQQPVSLQSALLAHVTWHALPPRPFATQDKPSQHGVASSQLPLALAHSPARALGLEQLGTVFPASPVQKHEAWSNVMHVYAAQ